MGYFGDESFQSITCTGTDNLTRTTKRQNTQITQNNNTFLILLLTIISRQHHLLPILLCLESLTLFIISFLPISINNQSIIIILSTIILVNSTTDTLKRSRLRERTDRTWFSRTVRHPVRKRSCRRRRGRPKKIWRR